jgi:UDP-N-acetylmuramoylalanine-D-glutamate ligase
MKHAVPAYLQPLLTRPVAILGGGVSGEGAHTLVAALGATGTVYDAKGADFTAKAAAGHALDRKSVV